MEASTVGRIFEPSSIAVVGASADPAKRGHQILRALAEAEYPGRVYPVNPRGGTILDHPVVPSVEELPNGVDLAVLCTPAAAAPGIVRACGSRDVGGAVVLAVGFGESGAEGRALEEELRTAGRESGVRIVGPNTSGLLNLGRGVNLVGARGVRAGGLAVLVQSGNMALALMTEVTERSWDGISLYVGVGNEVDLGFAEALDYLGSHEGTHAVLVYAEGFRDPAAFLEAAARVSRKKPVVALKSGRTARGAEAALSHTGSVAGPYRRLSAGMAQAGVVELRRTDELLHVGETLGRQPLPRPGSGIAILSDGGGQGTLAVDLLVESGAPLAVLGPSTREALRALLGPAAAVSNPVDLAGAADADPEVFAQALEILVADPAVGSVLLIGLFGGYGIRFSDRLLEGERAAAEAMAARARSAGCALVVHTMYALHRSAPLAELGGRGVPVVASLDVACRCVAELHRRSRWLERPSWPYPLVAGSGRGATDGTRQGPDEHAVVARARREGRTLLTEPEARQVMSDHGVGFGPSEVADSADAAVAAFRRLGGPVAMKLVSWRITHKSDAGGVVLDVASEAEVHEGYARIAASTDEAPCRILLTPMLPTPRLELLVGACRDPELGAVVTVGAGGVWVEALDDVSVRVLPVERDDIVEMFGSLGVSRLLDSGRGRPAVDPDPLIDAVRALTSTLVAQAAIAEVEVNPLFVYDDRVAAVDARVVLTDPSAAPGTAPAVGG